MFNKVLNYLLIVIVFVYIINEKHHNRGLRKVADESRMMVLGGAALGGAIVGGVAMGSMSGGARDRGCYSNNK